MVICKEIDDYLKYVKEHPKWINKKRKQLIKNIVKPLFKRNDIFFDKETYENCLESAIMRWYTNNTSVTEDKYGNKMFGKVEPKLRKNDGFMAFDVAMFCKDELEVQIIYI